MDTALQMPPLFMSANFVPEKQMVELFVEGLKAGIRGFDTAREYKVEKKVGRSLKKALDEVGLKRADIFIQSRICNEEIMQLQIGDEVQRSLDKMGLDYLDCFMFHWPTPDYYIEAWKQLEDVRLNTQLTKYIGMCNCRLRHLEKMEHKVTLMPEVLQVEVTPFWHIKDLKEYCDRRHIRIQAFSPLCKMIQPIKENEILNKLARKYDVSVPQIILRWHVQRGIVPISLTSKVERVRSNFDIWNFELTTDDMHLISMLDCGYKFHLESATCYGF